MASSITFSREPHRRWIDEACTPARRAISLMVTSLGPTSASASRAASSTALRTRADRPPVRRRTGSSTLFELTQRS